MANLIKRPVTTHTFHPITPEAPLYRNMALWCVYGAHYEPRMICCRVTEGFHGELNIWGYVPPQRKNGKNKEGGFRLLGIPLGMFRDTEENVYFFAQHQHALGYVAWLTQPKEEFFTAGPSTGKPWKRQPQTPETLLEPEPLYGHPNTHLSDLAAPPLNRDEKLFQLLRQITTTEEIFRVFTRMRARLIEIYNRDGYKDQSIAFRTALTGNGVRRIREKLKIGAEFDPNNLQAQEEAFHRAQQEEDGQSDED